MVEESQGKEATKEQVEELLLNNAPLERDIVSLEECENGEKAITTSTLVGKVICSKVLNRAPIKTILLKAWGEPKSMSITDLEANTYMFNFLEDEMLKRI